MAAVLDRPLFAVGDAEGSALGAAALGLHALGHSPQLEDAPAMLASLDVADPDGVNPDALLVATYARTRTAVPRYIDALDAVAELYRS
jgi:gluconokinase